MESTKRGNRKTRVGTVVSNKMEKTIVVVVERRVLHPVYKKFVKSQSASVSLHLYLDDSARSHPSW